MSRKKVLALKRFIFINIGLFIMAIGLMVFLEPSNLAVGGISGLSMVIRSYFPSLNLGILILFFNVILIILSFILIGPQFSGYTIYSSVALSFMITVIQKFFNFGVIFPNDLMITLLVGILTSGIGMAIVFYQNASTGGTDIIAKIINKYTHIEIGKSLFLSDALITIAAGVAFSPRIGAYAFLGILMNGFVIDKVIAGFEIKSQSLIISEKHKEIRDYIIHDLNRGATYVKVIGSYSGEDKMMINVVLSKREYIKLKKFVRTIDPRAFITMHYTHEVLGEGFDLKVVE